MNVNVTGEGTNWWAQNVKKRVYSDYVHTDRLGSVVNLADQYGRVPAQIDYDDWGKVTAYQSLNISGGYRTVLPEITCAGHQYDDVLGMYYAKARMYDAENRRFTAMDPVKGNIANPMAMVQYLYVVDNPLRWVDPLGLWTAAIGVNAAAAFALGVSVGTQVVVDGYRNIAIIGSFAGGAGTPNLSAGGVVTFTSASTVHDLKSDGIDIGLAIGGSAGLALTGGLEFAMSPTTNGDAIYSVSFSVAGGPIPVELHANLLSGSAASPSFKWDFLYDIMFDLIEAAFMQLSCENQKAVEEKIGISFE